VEYGGGKCASTSPGMIVPPRAFICRAVGDTAGAAAANPAYVILPSVMCKAPSRIAAAPVPGTSWPLSITRVPVAVRMVVNLRVPSYRGGAPPQRCSPEFAIREQGWHGARRSECPPAGLLATACGEQLADPSLVVPSACQLR